jgi:hypothetical protein
MAAALVDVNKGTIMSMLRTDVFGFKPQDVESQAKDVYHLVSGGDRNVKLIGGYVRTMQGLIIVTRQEQPDQATSASKKKKK